MMMSVENECSRIVREAWSSYGSTPGPVEGRLASCLLGVLRCGGECGMWGGVGSIRSLSWVVPEVCSGVVLPQVLMRW